MLDKKKEHGSYYSLHEFKMNPDALATVFKKWMDMIKDLAKKGPLDPFRHRETPTLFLINLKLCFLIK